MPFSPLIIDFDFPTLNSLMSMIMDWQSTFTYPYVLKENLPKIYRYPVSTLTCACAADKKAFNI